MFGTARANGAEQGDQKNDRGEDRNQHPANPFSSFLVGEHRSGGFGDCRRDCHQRPPADPKSFSL